MKQNESKITYDPKTNTIIINGYTESKPCTPIDIKHAITDKKWPVSKRRNETK